MSSLEVPGRICIDKENGRAFLPFNRFSESKGLALYAIRVAINPAAHIAPQNNILEISYSESQ